MGGLAATRGSALGRLHLRRVTSPQSGGQRRCCLGRNRRANLPRAAYYRYYLFASAPYVRLACTPCRPLVCFALRADTGPRPLEGRLCMRTRNRWHNKCAAYNGWLCSAYRFINAHGRLIDSHVLRFVLSSHPFRHRPRIPRACCTAAHIVREIGTIVVFFAIVLFARVPLFFVYVCLHAHVSGRYRGFPGGTYLTGASLWTVSYAKAAASFIATP